MFNEKDSIYLYVVDLGTKLNSFGFLSSDNGTI